MYQRRYKIEKYLRRIYVVLFSIEEYEGVIGIRKSKKNRQHNDQKKKYKKNQTTIYKTLHIKLMFE